MVQTIRNPIEYMVDEVTDLVHDIERAGKSMQRTSTHVFTEQLGIHRIGTASLKEALKRGYGDFTAHRTGVDFLIGIYPLVSLLIAAAAFNHELVPLLFPIISGTLILGPFVGVVLYEMSRRREITMLRHHEESHSWANAVSVMRSRNFGPIVMLGLILGAIPLFIGLVVVMPVLCHATRRLYRKVQPRYLYRP